MEETGQVNQTINDAAAYYYQHKDKESAEKVLGAGKGLIKYFARLYGGGCCEDDLFQAGSLGLLKALRNFDPQKETSFVTFASHCIMGEVRHLARKEASFYRPGCIAELQAKVDHEVQKFIKENGDVPGTEYIAQKLKIKEESVIEVMRAGFVSFDDIDASRIHSTAYETFHLPIEDKLTLYHALKKLTNIQQKVVQMIFIKDMTQQQVASQLGISQRQVSRVKDRSMEILRENINKE